MSEESIALRNLLSQSNHPNTETARLCLRCHEWLDAAETREADDQAGEPTDPESDDPPQLDPAVADELAALLGAEPGSVRVEPIDQT